MKRRHSLHPMTRLSVALGVAARHIGDLQFRKQAVRDAHNIPKCRSEIGGGRRGEMARLGRKTMLGLLDLAPDQYPDAAAILRACADAVASRFEVTDEVALGERRRRFG